MSTASEHAKAMLAACDQEVIARCNAATAHGTNSKPILRLYRTLSDLQTQALVYECEEDLPRAYMMWKTMCRFFLHIVASHNAFNQKIVSKEKGEWTRNCELALQKVEGLHKRLTKQYELDWLQYQEELAAESQAQKDALLRKEREEQERKDFEKAEELARRLKDLTPSPPPPSVASPSPTAATGLAEVAAVASSVATSVAPSVSPAPSAAPVQGVPAAVINPSVHGPSSASYTPSLPAAGYQTMQPPAQPTGMQHQSYSLPQQQQSTPQMQRLAQSFQPQQQHPSPQPQQQSFSRAFNPTPLPGAGGQFGQNSAAPPSGGSMGYAQPPAAGFAPSASSSSSYLPSASLPIASAPSFSPAHSMQVGHTIGGAPNNSSISGPPSAYPSVNPASAPAASAARQKMEPKISETLRPIHLPVNVLADFYSFAQLNTDSNIETCGILCGRFDEKTKDLWITHVLIPNQSATADTCVTTDEEQLIALQIQHDLLTLGWIHTHPSQTCFLSSIDMHTHFSYQLMLNEAIAIVLAPKHSPNSGVFHCTLQGMKALTNCSRSGFHKHEEPFPLYSIAPHYKWEKDPKFKAKFMDLRPRNPVTRQPNLPQPTPGRNNQTHSHQHSHAHGHVH